MDQHKINIPWVRCYFKRFQEIAIYLKRIKKGTIIAALSS